MTYTLILSPEAEKDILTALEYTQDTWGKAQADIYSADLDAGLKLLAGNPHIGRERSDISPKHRSFPIKKHIAVYFVEGETIYLSRLFHHSKDIMRHHIPS